MITLYDKGGHIPLLWTHLIPATLEGRAMHNVQNAMFAAAMAYCGGVKLEDIRHGLRTFDTTFFQAPGRMNVFDEHPFRVILDFAHNPHAVEAMCKVVDQLPVAGRRIVVVAAPGDRRDEDIRQVGVEVAGHFDVYVCRRDDSLRGREDAEVPAMLAQALRDQGVPEQAIHVISSEVEAVDAALRLAEQDDLLLIFADQLQRTWKQITHFRADTPLTSSDPDEVEAERAELPELGQDDVDIEGRLMRDERGVYLAPQLDD
jgi:cyanophycin synthetase